MSRKGSPWSSLEKTLALFAIIVTMVELLISLVKNRHTRLAFVHFPSSVSL